MIRLRNQYVSSEELGLFQGDPEREAKLEWIATTVVCRECGQKRSSIATAHLMSHDLDQKTYHAKWPGAPVLSEKTRKHTRAAALKFARKDPNRHRQNSAAWRADPKNAEKLKQQYQRAVARRRANPEPRRAYERERYPETRIPKATEAELAAFQKDPYSVRYVVCLEPGCRAKLKDIGCAHLAKIHSLTPEAYIQKYPGMSTKVTRTRGRRKEAEEAKQYYIIGQQVERYIPIELKSDKRAIMNARQRVSGSTGYDYDSVAQYHKEYRLFVRRTRNANPAR